MAKRTIRTIIGTKETKYGVWQLTYSGEVFLDSEKYLSIREAEKAARNEVSRAPSIRVLSSDVGYGHLAPRFNNN